ncbi:MAG: hypothetical protein FJX77_08330 [Armatimonadetes bacterium]|nr:hypothetical protein [Armatimonadota bacterium]
MSVALRRCYRGATLAGMEDVAAGERRNYYFDHQGTVQCLTDMNGNVTDRFAADAWGVEVKREGTSINRQWYVGNLGYYREVDRVLDYVRARWLALPRANWLARDRDPRQLPYGYAGQQPPRATDPTGWWCEAPPPNCCPDAVERAKQDKRGCKKGTWTGCLSSDDPELGVGCFARGNCTVVLRVLASVARNCLTVCDGKQIYDPDTMLDAKAVCCEQAGQSGAPPTVRGCAVLCCYVRGTRGIPRMDPCVAHCLFEHERRHLERCVQRDDRPGESPDECDPYCGQTRCLQAAAAQLRNCWIPPELESAIQACQEAHRRKHGGRDCPRSRPLPRPERKFGAGKEGK